MAEVAHLLSHGARTPLGASAAASAAAVRAGIALFEQHPFMIDKDGEPMVVAADAFFDADLPVLARLVELARSACAEALGAIDRAAIPSAGLPIFVGLPEPRPGLPENLVPLFAARLRDALREDWPVDNVVAVQKGHSAGLIAIASAVARVRAGSAGLYLAAGVDSYIDPLTLEWLDANNQLHSITNTWGFVPGEAAGCCLIGNAAAAAAAGRERSSRFSAIGIASEPHAIKTETVCVGAGMSEVLRQVTALLDDGLRVNDLISDMNGEPYRAEELGYAIVRHSQRFVEASAFKTPADCWGDVGAASGPLFGLLAETAARRGYALGLRTVCCTSSESGARAALLIETPAAVRN